MNDYLEHHGVKDQKWGIRRYQNPDGTLTELGKQRLRKDSRKLERLQNRTEKRLSKQEKYADKFNKKNSHRIFRKESAIKKSAEKLSAANSRFTRAFSKANRFYKKMEKRYGDSLVTELDKKLVTKGQAYANASMNNALMSLNMAQLGALSNQITNNLVRGGY